MFNFLTEKVGLYRFITIFIFTIIALKPLDGKTQADTPLEIVQKFNSALLESMQRAEMLKFSGRYELLKPIIKESFALPFMARKSIGRYWKKLKPDEKLHYVEVYTDWSVATYARRFDDYSGETFYVLPKTETDGNTVTVASRLTKADGEKIDFFYKLRRIDEKWQIVDIQISGVSQLALTRSQFLEVIKSEDFAALISKLQDKINLFSMEKQF